MNEFNFYIVAKSKGGMDYYLNTTLELDMLMDLDYTEAYLFAEKQQAQKLIDEKLANEYPKLSFEIMPIDRKKEAVDVKRFYQQHSN